MGGGLRRERALGVHDRHPLVGGERGGGEREEERGAAAPQRRVQRRDLSARNSRGKRGVERGDAEREAAANRGDEPLEPLGKRELEVRPAASCRVR